MFDNHSDGLVREKRNSIANALELRLSCTNPSYIISADWAAVAGTAFQLSAASGADRRSVGDPTQGLDHSGLYWPAFQFWYPSDNLQRASAVWPMLVCCGWICAAWQPLERLNHIYQAPFYLHILISITAWISNHKPYKCGMKLLIHWSLGRESNRPLQSGNR